jgi:hypothetical protein
LILGSILGGVSSHFIQNPILAAAAGVGGIALGALVQHWGKTREENEEKKHKDLASKLDSKDYSDEEVGLGKKK